MKTLDSLHIELSDFVLFSHIPFKKKSCALRNPYVFSDCFVCWDFVGLSFVGDGVRGRGGGGVGAWSGAEGERLRWKRLDDIWYYVY